MTRHGGLRACGRHYLAPYDMQQCHILFPRYKSVKTAQSFKSLQSTLLILSTLCASMPTANQLTMLQVLCGKKAPVAREI